jgi:hypothetical protein
MSDGYEGEVVRHLFGWRIRLYLGHTGRPDRRFRAWHSDLGSRGVYVVPWANRVVGAQWRRLHRLHAAP